MNPVTLINELWTWTYGLVAGWGLTITLLVGFVVFAHVRLVKLNKRIESMNNNLVTENRDLSIRLRKLEK